MDKSEIVQAIMNQIDKNVAQAPAAGALTPNTYCGLTEYVGTAPGDTIGLVIASVDPQLQEAFGIDKKWRSLGIVGARVGAGPHAWAADDAVKSSNVTCIKFELPRDTKGGGGHGCLVVFGAEEVSDARRAVEITLDGLRTTYFGDVYGNEAGHVEVQYTARASHVLADFFGAELGKAFGLVCCGPGAIGVVSADALLKAADVEATAFNSPAKGTSFSNEGMVFFKGDSGAVKQGCIAGREVGIELLSTLGSAPASMGGTPYIV